MKRVRVIIPRPIAGVLLLIMLSLWFTSASPMYAYRAHPSDTEAHRLGIDIPTFANETSMNTSPAQKPRFSIGPTQRPRYLLRANPVSNIAHDWLIDDVLLIIVIIIEALALWLMRWGTLRTCFRDSLIANAVTAFPSGLLAFLLDPFYIGNLLQGGAFTLFIFLIILPFLLRTDQWDKLIAAYFFSIAMGVGIGIISLVIQSSSINVDSPGVLPSFVLGFLGVLPLFIFSTLVEGQTLRWLCGQPMRHTYLIVLGMNSASYLFLLIYQLSQT